MVFRYYECGPVAGKVFCGIVAIDYLVWRAIEWIWPHDQIDIAPDFPAEMLTELDDNDFAEASASTE